MIARSFVYFIASGQSYFTGVAFILAGVVLAALSKNRYVRVARNNFVCLGGMLVLMSSTPLPPWSYALLVAATALWLLGEAYWGRVVTGLSLVLRIIVALAWGSAALVEWPHQATPILPRLDRPEAFGIIGDSVTCGLGEDRSGTWPRLLAADHGLDVRDHSEATANVSSAIRQAAELTPDEGLVLLEIGGGDVRRMLPPAAFESGLAKLLAAVRRPGRIVVMFELPLPPSLNSYGRIQRRLAEENGVILIPKRILLGILKPERTNIDTIYLDPRGHRAMADAIWPIIRPAIQEPVAKQK